MKKVFLTGPITTYGNIEENIDNGIKATRRLMKVGYTVFSPFVLVKTLGAATFTHAQWMEKTLPWLETVDIVTLLPGWRFSKGSQQEREKADRLGLPMIELRNILDDRLPPCASCPNAWKAHRNQGCWENCSHVEEWLND